MTSKCFVCYENIVQGHYHPKCAKKLFGSVDPPFLDISQKNLEKFANEIVSQRLAVPGVQKKLSLGVETMNTLVGGKARRLTIVGYLGGTYILKPPTEEYPEMPEIEDLTMWLAQICGIQTALHGLIPMADGQTAYITKRFDRVAKKKIAVEDLCQLSGKPTELKYKASHEGLGKIICMHSSNTGDDALRYFELVLFSFITGNTDMHMKNFSLMINLEGKISLTPAYDLLATRLLISEKDDPEELALTLNGKKTKLKRSDFTQFGKIIKIPESALEKTFVRFISHFTEMKDKIDQSFLSPAKKEEYCNLLRSRMERIRCYP